MTLMELFVVTLAIITLAILRFGVPLLIMWLFRVGCCRLLKLQTA